MPSSKHFTYIAAIALISASAYFIARNPASEPAVEGEEYLPLEMSTSPARPKTTEKKPSSQTLAPQSPPTEPPGVTPMPAAEGLITSPPPPVEESPTEPQYKTALATIFWVGESAGSENGYISNRESAWDEDWLEHFGGIDDPKERCGFYPCAFTPRENPFYVALPYDDRTDEGERKSNATAIPWFASISPSATSVIKNRWIEIRKGPAVCYGQWEDVGPFETDDVEYVFGPMERAKNMRGLGAGIDLSPALADCAGIDGADEVMWRHIEARDVPSGPWTKILTIRN